MPDDVKETVDQETDEVKIAERVETDARESLNHYQALKAKFTDYDHDFLAHREKLNDPTKANYASPDPFSDVRIMKGRLKSAILSSYPYAYAIPEGTAMERMEKEVLGYELSYFYSHKLFMANFAYYLDLWLTDTCKYGTGHPVMQWRRDKKPMPAYVESPFGDKPLYREGRRVFVNGLAHDGIELGVASIDDVYYPPYCADALNTPWLIMRFRATLNELASQTYIRALITDAGITYEEVPLYHNLDKIREKKKTYQIRTDTEYQRKKSAYYQSIPYSSSGPMEFWMYFTPNKIYVKPVNENFLIRNDDNSFGRIPIGVSYIYGLPNEVYGMGVLAPVHKHNRYQDEMMNVMLDQLFKEDQKTWVYAKNKIQDVASLYAGLGGIIGVDDFEGDVRGAVYPIETRAIANEIFPMVQRFDYKRQTANGAVDAMKGGGSMGPEKTATQSSYEFSGATGSVEDYLFSLEGSLGRWVFDFLQHLCHLNYNAEENISIYGNNEKIADQIQINTAKVLNPVNFRFQWAGRERARDTERASLTNVLQVMGAIPPEAYATNPVLLDLVKEIILLSPIRNADILVKKLEERVGQMQMMPPAPTNGGGNSAPPEIVNRLEQFLRQTAERSGQFAAPNMQPRG